MVSLSGGNGRLIGTSKEIKDGFFFYIWSSASLTDSYRGLKVKNCNDHLHVFTLSYLHLSLSCSRKKKAVHRTFICSLRNEVVLRVICCLIWRLSLSNVSNQWNTLLHICISAWWYEYYLVGNLFDRGSICCHCYIYWKAATAMYIGLVAITYMQFFFAYLHFCGI